MAAHRRRAWTRRLHCTGRHRQPAPAGCWVAAQRRPAVADDDDYNLLSTLHGPPSGSRLRPSAGWWRTGGLLARTTTTLGRHPAAGPCRLRGGGAQEACLHGQRLHCTGRHPPFGSSQLLGVGAQEACLLGRPRLHCMGCHLAAGSGRLLGGGAQETCWRGRPTTLHGQPSCSWLRPAAGCWRTGGLRAWTTTTLHGPPSASRHQPAA